MILKNDRDASWLSIYSYCRKYDLVSMAKFSDVTAYQINAKFISRKNPLPATRHPMMPTHVHASHAASSGHQASTSIKGTQQGFCKFVQQIKSHVMTKATLYICIFTFLTFCSVLLLKLIAAIDFHRKYAKNRSGLRAFSKHVHVIWELQQGRW